MNLSKKIKIAALLVASFFVTGCGSQANIGYIDSAKIMDTPQIKSILEEGQKKATEIQNEAAANLENNPDWTEEERNNALSETQRKLIGISQAYNTQLRYKLDEAIQGILQEKNLDVVVDSSKEQPIVLHGGIDITNEVVQKLQ